MSRSRLVPFLMLASCLASRLVGQGSRPRSYYGFVPPVPPIVAAESASARLHLYGDAAAPGYRDDEPVDGMDDARARVLLAIAERFSPILRRNNFLAPIHFLDAMPGRPLLIHDTWWDGDSVRSDTIDLRARDGSGAAIGDAKLDALLRELHPRRPESRIVSPGPEVQQFLYVDPPGSEEKSWRAEFAPRYDAGLESRIYAHLLVHDHGAAHGERRFVLAVQYWFYFPYNDAANNHEGDWEHVNVWVTTADRESLADRASATAGLLSRAEIERVLAAPAALESTIIWKVDYYFHHNVLTLDYLAATLQPPDERRRWLRWGVHMWRDTAYVDGAINHRLALAGGRLRTHPFGHIGGDSKGVDETFSLVPRLRRAYHRNSGAIYPFAGFWQNVGPAGVTEEIKGRDVPRVRDAPDLPWHMLVDDRQYLTYPAARIQLLPDWERLESLVLERADVRRAWAWLLLPMRFGYPESASLFERTVRNADLGNLGAVGPAFTTGWNRIGETSVFRVYSGDVLRVPLAATNPAANFKSGLGALNVALGFWSVTPGGNVAVATVMPWVGEAARVVGHPARRTFTRGHARARFTTEGQGAALRFGGDDFARLLPRDVSLLPRGDASGEPEWRLLEGSLHRADELAPNVLLDLHFGRRLAVENSFTWGTTALSQTFRDDRDGRTSTVRGSLTQHTLMSGFRYNVLMMRGDALQTYVRAGWAWTAYRREHVTVDDGPVDVARVKGGYLPTVLPSRYWWPNAGLLGGGVEVFTPVTRRLLKSGLQQGYGVRLDVTMLRHRMDGADPAAMGTRYVTWGDASLTFLLGW